MGKPLKMIAGKTMIRRVFENAVGTGVDDVIVATDDARILEEVERFGGRAMMTASTHLSGTDRLAEVARCEGWAEDAIVVNVQGDEPCLPPEMIRSVAHALLANPAAGISTMAHRIEETEDVLNPNVVKVVIDAGNMALYFSRAPIPHSRDAALRQGDPLPGDVTFLRHLGLYGYRVGALLSMADAAPTMLEKTESLEQLRAMELGIRIHVSLVDEAPGIGVDTEEDLARVEQLFLAQDRDGTSA